MKQKLLLLCYLHNQSMDMITHTWTTCCPLSCDILQSVLMAPMARIAWSSVSVRMVLHATSSRACATVPRAGQECSAAWVSNLNCETSVHSRLPLPVCCVLELLVSSEFGLVYTQHGWTRCSSILHCCICEWCHLYFMPISLSCICE